VEEAACAKAASGYTYARREPDRTALYQVLQQHLLTFEQEWTDKSDGRTLPSFVTEEPHKFLDCGILARGFAHLYCDTCHEHYAVAFSCKARAVCPSCLGRRMHDSWRALPLGFAFGLCPTLNCVANCDCLLGWFACCDFGLDVLVARCLGW
jgi:hypothetical protein